jgi:arsenite-transporting ATPase
MPTALEWYMDHVFRLERTLTRVARPFVSAFSDLPVPGEDYFRAIQALYDRMEGVRELLEDQRLTSARVVTNAENMVVRETRRAFMYIGLYGLNVDLVVANRLLPADLSDPHFTAWRRTQDECLREIEESFAPVPVRRAPLFDDQVLGMERLGTLAEAVYGTEDPTAVFREARPWRFEKEGDTYRVLLRLPFVAREDVELNRSEDQLIVRIGGFKRHVTLPDSLVRMRPQGAEMLGDELCITFAGDEA